MKSAVICTVAACLVASSVVHADPWPHRKPGLWQITIVMSASPMPPMSTKYCIDAATESALMSTGQGALEKMCSKHDIHVSGSTGTIDTVCTFGALTQTTHSDIAFASNTAYHSVTRVHSAPPPKFGQADSTMTNDAKWVGPCPQGMVPGDMVMANGMKVHFAPNAH